MRGGGSRYSGIRGGFSSVNRNNIIGRGYFKGEAAVEEGSSIFRYSKGDRISSKEEEKTIGSPR